MTKTPRFLAAALLVLGAACANAPAQADDDTPELTPSGPGAPAEDSCLRIESIRGFEAIDDTIAVFTEGGRRRFKVMFRGGCPGLDFAWAIKVDSHGMMCLSKGDVISFADDDIIHASCVVDSVEYLPPKAE
ncbi:MAG TPA: DUF6491 family protein [Micropepsaceae bacterium]|nr:DUF6491 family protein [Micropepsaceae bacterium]